MEDFRSWWAAGFEDVIPIVPPDAPISASSKITPEQRGKVPGRQNGRGTWGGWDWRRHRATERDLERWAQSGAGIGLRTAHFPALDIDVLDPELAELIEGSRWISARRRAVGRAPKRALAYRTDEPFGRMRLWFGPPGEEHTHLVELLGDGEQYLVDGIHPGTQRPYEWSAHPTRNGGAGALTMIDQAQVEALFVELETAPARARRGHHARGLRPGRRRIAAGSTRRRCAATSRP